MLGDVGSASPDKYKVYVCEKTNPPLNERATKRNEGRRKKRWSRFEKSDALEERRRKNDGPA